jgi:hypothetical protein
MISRVSCYCNIFINGYIIIQHYCPLSESGYPGLKDIQDLVVKSCSLWLALSFFEFSSVLVVRIFGFGRDPSVVAGSSRSRETYRRIWPVSGLCLGLLHGVGLPIHGLKKFFKQHVTRMGWFSVGRYSQHLTHLL